MSNIYRGYNLSNSNGHITIEKNGEFVSTADNVAEAYSEIDNLVGQ